MRLSLAAANLGLYSTAEESKGADGAVAAAEDDDDDDDDELAGRGRFFLEALAKCAIFQMKLKLKHMKLKVN